jgi:hypothetical protein
MEYNLFSTPEILLFFHIREALQRRLNFTPLLCHPSRSYASSLINVGDKYNQKYK